MDANKVSGLMFMNAFYEHDALNFCSFSEQLCSVNSFGGRSEQLFG